MRVRWASDHLRARVVGLLKIVLPLAALALLSTLFLVARTIDPADAIPYAEVDVEERAREPRMTDPTYAGLTRDGAILTLTATEARPGSSTRDANAVAMTARLETPDGATSDLAAQTARLDSAAEEVILGGGVTVANSTGWTVRTDTMIAATDTTGLRSAGAIAADGPGGRLTAGRMTLDQRPDGTYVLVFQRGVKLVYEPGR